MDLNISNSVSQKVQAFHQVTKKKKGCISPLLFLNFISSPSKDGKNILTDPQIDTQGGLKTEI